VTEMPPADPVGAVPVESPAAPAPRRRPGTVVVGILSVVLLLATGALATLYVVDRGRAAQANADQQARIAELQQRVAQLENDLDKAETRLRRAENDLAAARKCPEAVQDFIDLMVDVVLSGQTQLPSAQAQRLVLEMVNACGVAM
jgi:type II secretory pathway component PulJ